MTIPATALALLAAADTLQNSALTLGEGRTRLLAQKSGLQTVTRASRAVVAYKHGIVTLSEAVLESNS